MLPDFITINPPQGRPYSDDELFELCVANPLLMIERDVEGRLIIRELQGARTALFGVGIFFSLEAWNRQNGSVWVSFGGDAGFFLPDGSMRSPRMALISAPRWQSLTPQQQERFAPLCPDFVCEVKSPTDSLPVLMKKMNAYMANGARLGWLVDPEQREGWMYLPGMEPEQVHGPGAELSGKDVLPGLIYCLDDLK